MAVQLESAARLAALRDKADAVTGESSATLAGAVDALIAGFGSGGGGGTGGSFESGEVVLTTSNLNRFAIPVTSKKSHFVMYPKVFEDETHNSGRISYWLDVDGWGEVNVRKGGGTYLFAPEKMHTTFNDASIDFFTNYECVYNEGNYYWFAW